MAGKKCGANNSSFVMPVLVTGIHVFLGVTAKKAWMAGSSPAMTVERFSPRDRYGDQSFKNSLAR
jgi:hypothetical protein